ncbi:coil containing protein [Vibrio phage 13VT501A]|nr:coil containing protein [Vibrio phage 13VT501A]
MHMDEFKVELINLLNQFMDEKEVNEKWGITIEFIADGMIKSINDSARLGHIARNLPESVGKELDKLAEQMRENGDL